MYLHWPSCSSLFLNWIYGSLKFLSFGLSIYFAQEDFISSTGISWHVPGKSYCYFQKVISLCKSPWQWVGVSLFETYYVLPFQGRFPWLKKKLRLVLGRTPKFWENLIWYIFSFYLQWKLVDHRQWTLVSVIFLLPLVNVGSSSSVNGGDMIFSLCLQLLSW